jgi:thiaminase/transcriptional activator TenA
VTTASRPLHQRLWHDNLDLAGACLQHPFVRGLADGNLDREAFRRYVGQDAFFLRAFLAAYALAVARCGERLEWARVFHRMMGGALEELELHAGYAATLNIDLEEVQPLPATRAYVDFLHATAWTRPVGEVVASMTPCMRLYAYLGQQLAGRATPENPYREWIETYSSLPFQQLAGDLEHLLDETAEDPGAAAQAYSYAMRCELDFFEAALTAP